MWKQIERDFSLCGKCQSKQISFSRETDGQRGAKTDTYPSHYPTGPLLAVVCSLSIFFENEYCICDKTKQKNIICICWKNKAKKQNKKKKIFQREPLIQSSSAGRDSPKGRSIHRVISSQNQ